MLGDLNKLKVVELKAELANRGLDTRGVKAVLVDRLKAALDGEGTSAPEPSLDHGSEDQKSSQESNDEVLSAPACRGRRTTSTRDSEEEQAVDHSQSCFVTVEQSASEEQVAVPVELDTTSQLPGEDLEATRDQESTATHHEPFHDYVDNGCQLASNDLSNISNLRESPEIKADVETQPQETNAPEESSVSVPDVIQPSIEEEENTFCVRPVVEPPSSLLDLNEEQSVVDGHENPLCDNSSELAGADCAQGDVDVKVEPPDSNEEKIDTQGDQGGEDHVKDEPLEGSKRARRSRFTDNDDAAPVEADLKQEPMDTDGPSADVDTAIVKSESFNDRKRRHSSSRSPMRSRSPMPRKQEDEPEIEDSSVLLSWYDSDLNLIINKSDFLSATPMHQQGFGYMWAGARASFGFLKGKVCFEAKCEGHCDVSHLEDEPNPHVLRVGWSVQGTSMQLGEEMLSYGYGGTGKGSVNCQFKDYGKVFGVGDTITAYLDMDSEPKIISYEVNGEPQGVAFEVSSTLLQGKALFPHILSKNMKFSVNFSGEPSYPVAEGYSLCGQVALDDRVSGPRRPESKEDCEMLMMCGLPGSGKTVWANQHAAENPGKLFNILGTNSLIDKMKVMGLPRKRNYAGRWEVLIEKCTKCLQKLFEIAGRRRRNYILDQTNVYPSAVRRKMRSFDGFKRKAIVIVPTDDEFQRRIAKREAEEGKDVPETAVLEMKANFKLPEVGDLFSEVVFVELPEEEARTIVDKYREEAREKGFLAQAPKRFKSERSGSTSGGERKYDDRHGRDYRDRRDYRETRDNRDRDYRDRDRGNGFRPRGGPGDRNRSGWQPRGAFSGGSYGGHGGQGGWRDRNDGYRGGRPDRGSWRSGGGGGRGGGMGGGYDRSRGGGSGFNQNRSGYNGRAGSKGWGYNQGSGGSSWGSWSQQSQPDYSHQWQGQGHGQTAYSTSSWKGYSQQQPSQQQTGYGQQTGYSTQGYSSYSSGNHTYNWNQQYYQGYGSWGQQQTGAASSAVTGTGATSSSAVASTTSATYDPYQQQWQQYSSSPYGYSTSSGSAAAGATGTGSHGTK